jgi:hypothetical protein
MTKWREIFGFDGEDLDFETVHTRYRERALQLSELATLENLQALNWALDEARKELPTQRNSEAPQAEFRARELAAATASR